MSIAQQQSPQETLHPALQRQVNEGAIDPARIPDGVAMVRAEVHLLAEAIRKAPKLTTLRLSECHMDERGLQLIIDAAAEHPELEHLGLGRNAISADTAHVLADAIQEFPKLKSLRIRDTGVDAKSLRPILAALREHPSLEWVNFGQNDIGREGVRAICDTARTIPSLQHFNLMDCKLTAEDASPLASAIREMPQLITLHVHANPALEADEPRQKLVNALLDSPHPNLASVKDNIPDKRLEDLLSENDVQAYNLRSMLRNAKGDYGQLRCADFAHITARLPLINHNQRDFANDSLNPSIESFLDSLPALPLGETPSPTRLQSEDSRRLTILDNPQTWKRFDETADALESKGFTINSTFLNGQNSRGETWLECGLACAPEKVIPALNARQITLQTNALLTKEREPSALLKAVIGSGDVKPLFTADNCVGGNSAQIQQVYDALPPSLQSSINNLFALKQQVTAASRDKGGIGR